MTRKLENLRTLIEKEDREATARRLPELLEEFSEKRSKERALTKGANSIRSAVKLDEEVPESVKNFSIAASEVRQERSKLPQLISLFIKGQIDSTLALSVVESTIEAEESVTDASEALISDIEDTEIPAVLSIYGPDTIEAIKGQERVAAYTIENAGQRETRNLEIEIDSESSVSLSANMGALEERSSDEVKVTLDGKESTESRVILSALSDRSYDETIISIRVKNKLGLLERAVQQAKSIRGFIEESVNEDTDRLDNNGNGSGANGSGGIRNKIDNIVDRIDKIKNDLKEGRNQNSINNRIDSVINSVGAFDNQINSQKGKKIDEGIAAQTLLSSDILTETLQKAKEAEV